MKKYKLRQQDIDQDQDGLILNLPWGYRFDDNGEHVRGFDTITELRSEIKYIKPCTCADCQKYAGTDKAY
jgi:hypothetical protein